MERQIFKSYKNMEKFNSAIQLVFAAVIVLFGFGTMIRCIIAGSDFFYIIMFALIGIIGRAMFRVLLKEYKEAK